MSSGLTLAMSWRRSSEEARGVAPTFTYLPSTDTSPSSNTIPRCVSTLERTKVLASERRRNAQNRCRPNLIVIFEHGRTTEKTLALLIKIPSISHSSSSKQHLRSVTNPLSFGPLLPYSKGIGAHSLNRSPLHSKQILYKLTDPRLHLRCLIT